MHKFDPAMPVTRMELNHAITSGLIRPKEYRELQFADRKVRKLMREHNIGEPNTQKVNLRDPISTFRASSNAFSQVVEELGI